MSKSRKAINTTPNESIKGRLLMGNGVWREAVDWINLAQDTNRRWNLLNTVIKFRFILKAMHIYIYIFRVRKEVTCVVGKKKLDPSNCPSVVPSSSLWPTSTNHLAPVAAKRCHVVLGNNNSSNRITGEMERGSGKVWRGSIHGPAVAVSVCVTGCCGLSKPTPK